MSQITTHILDTSLGSPAIGVGVELHQQIKNQWQKIGSGKTDADGRVPDLISDNEVLPGGIYKLHFNTGEYSDRTQTTVFYPFVEITFQIADDGQHYHIPLLLNPFGYSTYRGS